MIDWLEHALYGVMRVGVALLLVAGIGWGLILTAADVLGVPQSRVTAVVAVVGVVVGLSILRLPSKRQRPASASPASLTEEQTLRAAPFSSSRWRELRELDRCHAQGLISDAQFEREKARILGPDAPASR